MRWLTQIAVHSCRLRSKLSTVSVHGHTVCMADGPGIIVAVICRGRPQPRGASHPSCDVASAHLKALLVLHALQAGFGDRLAAVVAADAESKEDMLEAYTARQIEAGGGSGGRDQDAGGGDVSTMPMFASFQVRSTDTLPRGV